jgi:hypothetical protein
VCGADSASLYLKVKAVQGDNVVCEAQNDAVLDGLMTVFHMERSSDVLLNMQVGGRCHVCWSWPPHCRDGTGCASGAARAELYQRRHAECCLCRAWICPPHHAC